MRSADEIIREAFGAAEPADAHRNALRHRRCGAAGERDRDGKVGALGQTSGQKARFRRAAEYEDAWHAAA